MRRGLHILSRWLPPALWAGFILLLSAQPSSRLPASGFDGADKLVHVALFAVLGALLTRAVLGAGLRTVAAVALAIAAAAAFGVLDEWSQQLSSGRVASVADAAADAIGACLGAAFWCITRAPNK